MSAENEGEEIRGLLDAAVGVDSRDAYRAWIQRYERCLASLRDRCRNRRRISTGRRNALIARIAQLEGTKCALDRLFVRVGAGRAVPPELSWIEIETAFNNRVLTGAVINSRYVEPQRFLEDARPLVLARVRDQLDRHQCLKVNTVFNGQFVAPRSGTAVKGIATRNRQLFRTSDLDDWYTRHVIETIRTYLDEFQERDSGWALSRILNLIVNMNRCNPMRAGCWIPTPAHLRDRKALVNVHSHDNACFAWSIVAALYPAKHHTDRCSQYPHYSTVLKLDGITFPMTLRQIARFERLNELSVNVFTATTQEDEDERKEIAKREKEGRFTRENALSSSSSSSSSSSIIVSLRLTDNKKERHVNLLYLTTPRHHSPSPPPPPRANTTDRSNTTVAAAADYCDITTGHFLWIKQLSRMLGSQLSGNKRKKYICERYA